MSCAFHTVFCRFVFSEKLPFFMAWRTISKVDISLTLMKKTLHHCEQRKMQLKSFG